MRINTWQFLPNYFMRLLCRCIFPPDQNFPPVYDHAPKHLCRLSATFICFLDHDAGDGNDHGGKLWLRVLIFSWGNLWGVVGKQRAVRNYLLSKWRVTVTFATANINDEKNIVKQWKKENSQRNKLWVGKACLNSYNESCELIYLQSFSL